MSKKKPLFITFEGIEGSGKTYQSLKLYNKLKKKKIPVLYTREPGGLKSAEQIRKLILSGEKNKFLPTTDTLLYLASRNELFHKKIIPAMNRGQIIICDRFTDSTLAYQVYGKGINKLLVDKIHQYILGKFKPDLTYVLKVNIKKSFQRMKKRKIKNRYDKLSKSFYKKVQNAFIFIAKKNKKRYVVVDNSQDSEQTEKIIYNKFAKIKFK
jgi:dTMP kinase